MPTINWAWEELMIQADGRYLSDAELKPFQQYIQTLPARTKTYEIMRAKSPELIKIALKKFMLIHPEVMQQHSKRCIYDMNMAICLMSVAMLRDDPRYFRESLMLWLANILSAYQRNVACLKAYHCLEETMQEKLPSVCNQLLKPYMDIIMEVLDIPPKLMATVQRGAASSKG
ncbi:phycobilisome protein [Arthrospira platensis]|jgi:hypothetical protein|uniref:Allophycocyanin alpha subunit n=1 Tax=Limnospira platensis NIES-46 TaxID=1236695 RepID=A0A5M3T4I8_LIMPL|nr:phycobilisome protein [Arthrospira platensis]AMW28117.1 phycobilisome protein [Arthrospira platensis YZ]KDR57252.1 phycobilisome protein [Arthrospira platensis str. Paraca]MBD2670901.1 phycobilisome protein [Arthrospira platensis FACHB-439]MBD2711726.1 phycobilisome protein [Arthrospira platensis FACHB-835]MDF2209237.1 phycobilisome protein [Arthrospira platensis NCB002]MDT9184360.1 phycobilisome protein [Limnospira sp. PMC 289.06]MDT9296519.1 phycobilisome protein [Arthrospira platensis 